MRLGNIQADTGGGPAMGARKDVAPAPVAQAGPRRHRALAGFELWPAALFYAPVAAMILWHGMRRGSLSLPARVNAFEREGICGWSKAGLYDAMGPEAQRWFAPMLRVPPRGDGSVEAQVDAALAAARAAGLGRALVAKPDGGARGTAVRRIEGRTDLLRYAAAFPPDDAFVLQRVVPYHHEAGILYVRPPGTAHGAITSLALKIAPEVTGDGVSTLGALIRRHPRARHHARASLARHRDRLESVPARGERVTLLFARNHCAGAEFRDGRHLLTPALERRIEAIADAIPGFHYGRFDVRYASDEALREGRGLGIVEVNGAGSEPLHAYDPDNGVGELYAAFNETLARVFEIGAMQRARGAEAVDVFGLVACWRRFERLRARAPDTG